MARSMGRRGLQSLVVPYCRSKTVETTFSARPAALAKQAFDVCDLETPKKFRAVSALGNVSV